MRNITEYSEWLDEEESLITLPFSVREGEWLVMGNLKFQAAGVEVYCNGYSLVQLI